MSNSGTRRATLHVARFPELTPAQLYGIMRVRSAVFVVEQDVVYLDFDGRDHEPGAVHLWHELGGEVVSTIRLLHSGEDRVIGRVATLPEARGQGLAAELIRKGIALSAGRAVELGAQAHLDEWYASFGFVRYGEGYFEDAIPHVHMRREPDAQD
jgi:ElaA protein